MRLRFAICICLLSCAWADTIHLKNGGTIQADSVRSRGDRVEYDVGYDSYAVPTSLVDHIDTSGATANSSSDNHVSANVAAPKINGTGLNEVAPDGKITPERLAKIEASGNKSALASALILLAIHEQQHGKTDEALSHMERALSLEPGNGDAAAVYAWLLLKQDRASLAQSYAEDAVHKAPESAFAHKILAIAYYKNDRIQDALAEFKKARELDPNDPEVEGYLKAVSRQAKAEADFRNDASTHFNMRYEGDKASPKLREQILLTLERHFDDLVSTMGLLPRDPISVVLYTNQTYFDVTLAPSWTAALNDGKLRIPIEGLTSVTPDLSRVLKHELAHSFIRQATSGRCPVWLNEGLAQLVEPQSAAKYRTPLSNMFQNGKQVSLQSMEGSFIGLDSTQAAIAYIESLAYVEYIRDAYGMNRIADIMRNLNEGQSAEESLKSVIHDDYSQLEDEFARHLR